MVEKKRIPVKRSNVFDELMGDYGEKSFKEKNIVELGYTETGQSMKLGVSEMGHTLISGMSRSGKSRMAKNMLNSIVKFADVAIYSPKVSDYVEYMDKAMVSGDTNYFDTLLNRTIGVLERRNEEQLRRSKEAGYSVRCEDSPMLIVIDEFATYKEASSEAARRNLKRIIAEGAGLNIFLMLITQVATKRVLDGGLKDNIMTLIAFKARDAYASRMAIGNRQAEFLELGQGIVQNVDKQFTITRFDKIG